MNAHLRRTITLAAAALTLASGSALAQGKGHEKQKAAKAAKPAKHKGEIVRVESRGSVAVPPGLAKKPGGMPPGQYKKLYPREGVSVLRDVLVRNGYTYVRSAPYGESQYVYYRLPNGTVQRAIIAPGTTRLSFSNVPASVVSQVLALLY
jgi:hypothetical protein